MWMSPLLTPWLLPLPQPQPLPENSSYCILADRFALCQKQTRKPLCHSSRLEALRLSLLSQVPRALPISAKSVYLKRYDLFYQQSGSFHACCAAAAASFSGSGACNVSTFYVCIHVIFACHAYTYHACTTVCMNNRLNVQHQRLECGLCYSRLRRGHCILKYRWQLFRAGIVSCTFQRKHSMCSLTPSFSSSFYPFFWFFLVHPQIPCTISDKSCRSCGVDTWEKAGRIWFSLHFLISWAWHRRYHIGVPRPLLRCTHAFETYLIMRMTLFFLGESCHSVCGFLSGKTYLQQASRIYNILLHLQASTKLENININWSECSECKKSKGSRRICL